MYQYSIRKGERIPWRNACLPGSNYIVCEYSEFNCMSLSFWKDLCSSWTSFMCVSWQPCGFMFLSEPSLQRHNSFDCTEFTLWWIAVEFSLSFYLMPVHTYQVSLQGEKERDIANAIVHRNSVSLWFYKQNKKVSQCYIVLFRIKSNPTAFKGYIK